MKAIYNTSLLKDFKEFCEVLGRYYDLDCSRWYVKSISEDKANIWGGCIYLGELSADMVKDKLGEEDWASFVDCCDLVYYQDTRSSDPRTLMFYSENGDFKLVDMPDILKDVNMISVRNNSDRKNLFNINLDRTPVCDYISNSEDYCFKFSKPTIKCIADVLKKQYGAKDVVEVISDENKGVVFEVKGVVALEGIYIKVLNGALPIETL